MGHAELEKIPIPARTSEVIPAVEFPVGPAIYTEQSAVAVFVVTSSRVPDVSKYKGRTFSAVIVFSPRNLISDMYV